MRAFVFFALLLSLSCHQKRDSEFSFEGKTQNVKNGTVIYLETKSGEKLDSTQIENNLFHLNTELPNAPLRGILRTKDGLLYKQIWLENKPMKLDATAHEFYNSIIDGSTMETRYSNLYRAVDRLSREEGKKALMDFVSANADNVLGPYVLSEWYVSWKKETTELLYDQLSEKSKNSTYGKEIRKYLDLNKNLDVGDIYVDFELKNQLGEPIKLSDIKAKLTLLEFWASWCAPCRVDNKKLVTLYKKYNPSGFEIFQVSLDDEKKSWLNAIEKDSLKWTNASDLKAWKNKAALIYGINLLPSNFLIDETGTILGKDLHGEALEQKIKEVLNP